MRKYIFFLLILFCPFILISQSLKGSYVAVLLKDDSKVIGELLSSYTTYVNLDVGIDEFVSVPKKDIVAIIPNYIMERVERGETLDEDVVILKNKMWITCELIEITSKAAFVKVNNPIIRIKNSQIEKINPKGRNISLFSDTNKQTPILLDANFTKKYLKEKWYHIGSMGFASDSGISSSFVGSAGFQYTGGYQVTQAAGFGLGLGYFSLQATTSGNFDKYVTMFPIYGDFRGYFTDKKTSLYYNVAIGATFINQSRFNRIEYKVSPKQFAYPAIGYKIGSDKVAILFDLGLMLGGVELLDESGLTNEVIITKVNRVALRIGVMF